MIQKNKIKTDIAIETVFMIILMITLPSTISSLQPEIDLQTQEVKQNPTIGFFASILSRTIYFFDIMPGVMAEEPPDFGCCHGVISDACRMTTYDACVAMGGLPWEQNKVCDDTNFCEKICCYNSNEGYCEKNTPRWLCQERGGQEVGEPNCDINICKKGCCFFDSLTDYITQQECETLDGTWNPGMTEYECSLQGMTQDEGCCVLTGNCIWTTANECPLEYFHKNTYCSDLSQYCNCQSHEDFGCYKDKLDVYWFDSCGNPEDIKEECEFGIERCINGECSRGTCDVVLPSGETTTLKNGESICVYDQKLTHFTEDPVLDSTKTALGKFGLDVTGSRHWRWICIDGELIVEPCADFRQQICVEGKVELNSYSFREAMCVPNAWQDCLLKETYEDCVNAEHGQCYWLENDTRAKELIDGLIWNLQNEGDINDEGKKDKFEELAGFENDVEGYEEERNMPKCLPKYPPGYDQREDSSYVPACFLGDYTCAVTETKKGLGEWHCEKNCECGAYGVDDWPGRESYWLELMARRCSALGDCGLKLNIKEKTAAGERTIATEDIIKNSGIVALRYEAKCEDDNDNGECDDDELERKEEVDLVELYAGGAKDPDGTDIDDWFKKEEHEMSTTIGQAMVNLVNELQDERLYDIYSLEATGLRLESGNIEFEDMLQFGMLPVVGFIFGIPFVAAIGNEVLLPALVVSIAAFKHYLPGVWSWIGKIGGKVFGLGPLQFLVEAALVLIVTWASYQLSYKIFRWIGLPEDVSESLAAGVGSGLGLATANWVWSLGLGTIQIIVIAAVIALIWFIFFAKKERVIVYEFQCLPNQPPDGGHDCEECNNDPSRPCSEYRCISLGASCEFVCEKNKDGECIEGVCTWADPGDITSPKIVSVDPVTNHYVYGFTEGPPGGGTDIRANSAGNCISPFETVTINLKTNEKAQCKIDYQPTLDFDSMNGGYIGPLANPSRHSKDHFYSTQLIQVLPELTVYVRCKDVNGNKNTGQEFKINFCSSQTDFAPPQILWIDPESNSKISKTKTQVNVTLRTNEPVEGCRWSPQPGILYDSMTNKFSCEMAVPGSRCNATLPFDGMVTNYYYFKCNDTSGNVNADDTEYILFPAEPLNITDAQPNGTIGGCEQITKVNLSVTTADGCCNGNAECFYKSNGDYIRFSTTGYAEHEHEVEIYPGITQYSYYIVCLDKDGNSADTTISFNVERDLTMPKITRIYKSGGSLFIRTDEDATCSYHYSAGHKISGCDFAANDTLYAKFFDSTGGTEHSVYWDDEPWYVKCYDECGNGWQKSSDCLAVIYPSDFD